MKKEKQKNIIKKCLLSILFFVGIYIFLFVSGYIAVRNDVFAAQKYLLIVSIIIWVCGVIGKNISERTDAEKQEAKKLIQPQNKYECALRYWKNFLGCLLLVLFLFALLTGIHFYNVAIILSMVVCLGCLFSFVFTIMLSGFEFFMDIPAVRSIYCLYISFQFLLFLIGWLLSWVMYVARLGLV